jgi:hypothetical protein
MSLYLYGSHVMGRETGGAAADHDIAGDDRPAGAGPAPRRRRGAWCAPTQAEQPTGA